MTTECYDEEDASSDASSHPPTSPLLAVDRSPSHSTTSSTRGSRALSLSRSPSPRHTAGTRAASLTGDYVVTGRSSLPRYLHEADSVSNSVKSYPMGRRGHFGSTPAPRTGSSFLSCVGRSHEPPASERKTAMPLKLAQTQVNVEEEKDKLERIIIKGFPCREYHIAS